MENPKKMSLISQLVNKRQKYDKIFSNERSKLQLYKWLRTELTYTSNYIEGNSLDRKETALIIEDGITTSSKLFKHYQEALNHAKAFDYSLDILQSGELVDENFVLILHNKLLSGINDYSGGFYRNCPIKNDTNKVAMPDHIKVPDLMSGLFMKMQKIKSLADIIIIHLNFVSICPFIDYNGTCARLLMNLLLIQNNICPIIISPRDKKRYMEAIEKAQLMGKIDDYVNFMLQRLNRSYDIVFDIFDSNNKIPQEKLLTISKFANLVKLPVSTVRYWVNIGKLKPVMYTDSGYMMFSKEQAKTL